jgi:predicted nucleic acid-binding protein
MTMVKKPAMNGRVLIDTSAWIDFFRRKKEPVFELVAGYLRDQKAIGSGIVLLELLRGGKSLKELTVIKELFSVIKMVDPNPESYRLAGQLGYSIARKGNTLGVVDLLVAQLAIENRLKLLTLDNHFKIIQQHSKLDLVAF